jgi:hypothetical protein
VSTIFMDPIVLEQWSSAALVPDRVSLLLGASKPCIDFSLAMHILDAIFSHVFHLTFISDLASLSHLLLHTHCYVKETLLSFNFMTLASPGFRFFFCSFLVSLVPHMMRTLPSITLWALA